MDEFLANFALPGSTWLKTIGAGVALMIGAQIGKVVIDLVSDGVGRLRKK